LRVEDESPFLGAARVSLLPDDGYEIIGTPTGTDGETQFSGILPGKYIVETSAAGYLTVRRTMQIEAGHRQRILYMVMKPRAVVQGAEKKQAQTTIAAVLPTAGTCLSRRPNQP
jgi:Cna protein B-type domain.